MIPPNSEPIRRVPTAPEEGIYLYTDDAEPPQFALVSYEYDEDPAERWPGYEAVLHALGPLTAEQVVRWRDAESSAEMIAIGMELNDAGVLRYSLQLRRDPNYISEAAGEAAARESARYILAMGTITGV